MRLIASVMEMHAAQVRVCACVKWRTFPNISDKGHTYSVRGLVYQSLHVACNYRVHEARYKLQFFFGSFGFTFVKFPPFKYIQFNHLFSVCLLACGGIHTCFRYTVRLLLSVFLSMTNLWTRPDRRAKQNNKTTLILHNIQYIDYACLV